MEQHEIIVENRHAALVTVKTSFELLTYVADIRKVEESARGIRSEAAPPLAIYSRLVRVY